MDIKTVLENFKQTLSIYRKSSKLDFDLTFYKNQPRIFIRCVPQLPNIETSNRGLVNKGERKFDYDKQQKILLDEREMFKLNYIKKVKPINNIKTVEFIHKIKGNSSKLTVQDHVEKGVYAFFLTNNITNNKDNKQLKTSIYIDESDFEYLMTQSLLFISIGNITQGIINGINVTSIKNKNESYFSDSF